MTQIFVSSVWRLENSIRFLKGLSACTGTQAESLTVPKTLDGNLISFSCKANGDAFQEGSDITMAYFTFHHIGNSPSLTLLLVVEGRSMILLPWLLKNHLAGTLPLRDREVSGRNFYVESNLQWNIASFLQTGSRRLILENSNILRLVRNLYFLIQTLEIFK